MVDGNPLVKTANKYQIYLEFHKKKNCKIHSLQKAKVSNGKIDKVGIELRPISIL